MKAEENFNDGPECPDCGKPMYKHDTTYSNINTHRARIGQHTGDVYKCEDCEVQWLENFLDNYKLERYLG